MELAMVAALMAVSGIGGAFALKGIQEWSHRRRHRIARGQRYKIHVPLAAE